MKASKAVVWMMLVSFPVFAQNAIVTPVQPSATQASPYTNIPNWELINNKACFDLEATKKLIAMDSSITLCEQKGKAYPRLVEDLKLANDELKQAIDVSKKSELILRQHNTELIEQLKTANAEKNTAQVAGENKLVWLLVGGLGVFAGGLALGYFMGSK